MVSKSNSMSSEIDQPSRKRHRLARNGTEARNGTVAWNGTEARNGTERNGTESVPYSAPRLVRRGFRSKGTDKVFDRVGADALRFQLGDDLLLLGEPLLVLLVDDFILLRQLG